MPIEDFDPEQAAEDMLRDRRIRQSTFCAQCGYNLKTLPKSYHCPECGALYVARSPKWQGIYTEHQHVPPVGETIALIICAVVSAFLVIAAIKARTNGLLITTVAFAVITIVLAAVVYSRTARFIQAQRLARQIAKREEEDD